MKVGDVVHVIKAPEGLRDDADLKMKTLVDLCVGHSFRIAAVDYGRVELLVGHMVGASDCMHSIYLEPECAEICNISK